MSTIPLPAAAIPIALAVAGPNDGADLIPAVEPPAAAAESPRPGTNCSMMPPSG